MSYEKPRILKAKGRVVRIANLELPAEPKTYLTAAVSATGTALTVSDNSGFVNTQLLLIGELGKDKTEIKKVNAAVTTGTALTSTAVTFAHGINTPVARILFNQFKIYGNTTNTSVGASLIATVDMQVDSDFTTYVNTGTEYDYYFALPFDSINTITGDTYSDGIANETQYGDGSVAKLIKQALVGSRSKLGGDITTEFLMDEINDCLRYISGQLKRWSVLQSFDYPLGITTQGDYAYSLPADIEDRNTYKSIIGVRVGDDTNLEYRDKREWEGLLSGVKRTQVRTQAAIGSVTLEIDNSYDFADSGSVTVSVSGTKQTITYTGVTRSLTAGALTGIPAAGTGSITAITPIDTNVWQDETNGQPAYYTVYDGSLYVWPIPDTSYDNEAVWLDYHTKKTTVDSDADIIEFQRYDAVKHWLTWKLRGMKNSKGQLDMKDMDFVLFQEIIKTMISKELSGQKFKTRPKINSIKY